MKKISISLIILTVVLTALMCFNYSCNDDADYVNNETFERAQIIITEQFDTLKQQLDSVKIKLLNLEKTTDRIDSVTTISSTNIDTIKNDVKVLKKGQSIIYDEVKKSGSASFWSRF